MSAALLAVPFALHWTLPPGLVEDERALAATVARAHERLADRWRDAGQWLTKHGTTVHAEPGWMVQTGEGPMLVGRGMAQMVTAGDLGRPDAHLLRVEWWPL